MRRWVQWLIIAVGVLLVVGLIAYARGPKHHEGDETGSHGIRIVLIGNGGGTTTATTTTTPEQPTTPSGPAVADLQKVMTQLGYYTGPIDGVYSDATTAAVTEMQKDLGVTADGVYGPATDAALKGKAKDVVVQIQTALTQYGYYMGPIDGVYGADTQAAVQKLQAELGVTVDGRFSAETADAFNTAVADGTLPVTTTPTTTTNPAGTTSTETTTTETTATTNTTATLTTTNAATSPTTTTQTTTTGTTATQ
jgi:peptidoglycan hydrolase-like protein with peptidoglycan-binding domain